MRSSDDVRLDIEAAERQLNTITSNIWKQAGELENLKRQRKKWYHELCERKRELKFVLNDES